MPDQIRYTFCHASPKDWNELARDLRLVDTAVTLQIAAARFDELADNCGARYPAIVTLWRSAWEAFIPPLRASKAQPVMAQSPGRGQHLVDEP